MPIKPIFRAEFEGDTFEVIEVAGRYHYRQKTGDETILEGESLMASEAIETLMRQITSWALDVDTGETEFGGLDL